MSDSVPVTERALTFEELQARRARQNFLKLEVTAVCFQLRSNLDRRTGDLSWRFVVALKAVPKTAFKTKEAPEVSIFQVPAQPLREGMSISDIVFGENNYKYHYLNRPSRSRKNALEYMLEIVNSYKNAGVPEVGWYEDLATADLREAFEDFTSGKCTSNTAHVALLKKIWPECVVEVPVTAAPASTKASSPTTISKALTVASEEQTPSEDVPKRKPPRAPRVSPVQLG